MARDSSTTIPEECCIRENYWRGSLDDSLPVCVAILTAFSETLSTRNLSSLVKFRDSSANALQTSVSDNMLGVRGLLRMCVEKYWEVVWREELLLVLQLMDTFGRVQIRIVQIMVRYFLKNDRKRYHVTATIFSFFEEQIARLLPFASICRSSLVSSRKFRIYIDKTFRAVINYTHEARSQELDGRRLIDLLAWKLKIRLINDTSLAIKIFHGPLEQTSIKCRAGRGKLFECAFGILNGFEGTRGTDDTDRGLCRDDTSVG